MHENLAVFHFSPEMQANEIQCSLSVNKNHKVSFSYYFILLHIRHNYMCFGDFLGKRTLCDAYHKELASH